MMIVNILLNADWAIVAVRINSDYETASLVQGLIVIRNIDISAAHLMVQSCDRVQDRH